LTAAANIDHFLYSPLSVVWGYATYNPPFVTKIVVPRMMCMDVSLSRSLFVLGCQIKARLVSSVCWYDACSLSCVTARANLINGITSLVVAISQWDLIILLTSSPRRFTGLDLYSTI
jgi:hypothetical protein